MEIVKNLISLASNNGANYVKFQKKNPELCVPKSQWNIQKETPWGYPMKYIDYKKKMEFGKRESDEIDEYCKKLDIEWFASCWDIESLKFICNYDVPFIKIASPCITDIELLKEAKKSGKKLILSTGMSTKEEISKAVNILGTNLKYILHTTSSYPTPNEEMNMSKLLTLKKLYGKYFNIGFSNHCADLIYIVQAYILGATMLEFHITLDRTLPGTDQWASIGPTGFKKIMNHINNVAKGWGDGEICIQKSEYPIIDKLRKD